MMCLAVEEVCFYLQIEELFCFVILVPFFSGSSQLHRTGLNLQTLRVTHCTLGMTFFSKIAIKTVITRCKNHQTIKKRYRYLYKIYSYVMCHTCPFTILFTVNYKVIHSFYLQATFI